MKGRTVKTTWFLISHNDRTHSQDYMVSNFTLDRTHYIQKCDNIIFCLAGHLFGGYGWTLVSGSIRYNYICEIAQTQASVIETYSRDFGNKHHTVYECNFMPILLISHMLTYWFIVQFQPGLQVLIYYP